MTDHTKRGRMTFPVRDGEFRIEGGTLCVGGASPMMECATLTGMDKSDAAHLVWRIMMETGLSMQDVVGRPEKPVDHTHAIEQLRWLIEHDFEERHRNIVFHRGGTNGVLSKHWWDHESRRLDIARLRSYIGAVRVLEGRA